MTVSDNQTWVKLSMWFIQALATLPVVRLLDALQQNLSDALLPLASTVTRSDAAWSGLPEKAHEVIGTTCAGVACFLEQLVAGRRCSRLACSVSLSFDDDLPAGFDPQDIALWIHGAHPGRDAGDPDGGHAAE